MRKKILVSVAGVLILLLAAGIYPAIKKYYARKGTDQVVHGRAETSLR